MSLVGIDIIEIHRIEEAIKRWGDRFLHKVYTENELAHCEGRVPSLAVRFAAKEAVMKALGTGAIGVAWREIEILPDRRGKPCVHLLRRAQKRAEEIRVKGLDISLAHSREYAIASVLGETDESSHRG